MSTFRAAFSLWWPPHRRQAGGCPGNAGVHRHNEPCHYGGSQFYLSIGGLVGRGLTIGYEKFVMDVDHCGAIARMVEGLSLDDNQLAADAYLEAGVGTNFLGVAHTLRNYKTANYRAELADTRSFEQWTDDGGEDMQQRAYHRWNKLLAEYQAPAIAPDVDQALLAFIAERKASMEDAWY